MILILSIDLTFSFDRVILLRSTVFTTQNHSITVEQFGYRVLILFLGLFKYTKMILLSMTVKVSDNQLIYGFNLKQHHIKEMKVRNKDCFNCNDQKEVLYRCKYDEFKNWIFLCGTCLIIIKSQYENTYQYGGTWKSKKK